MCEKKDTKPDLAVNTDHADEEIRERAARAGFLWPLCGLYALFYTFCLYKNADGITYPFFAAGTLLCFFYYTKRCKVPWKKGNGFYAVSIVLLGLTVCLTDDWKIQMMSKSGIFVLTLVLALFCFYQTRSWDFLKFFSAGMKSLKDMIRCIGVPFSDVRAALASESGVKKKTLFYILLGMLAGVPLLLVIVYLLLSADVVFWGIVEHLMDGIGLDTLFAVCLITALVFLVFYAFLFSLAKRGIPEQCPDRRKAEPILAITFSSMIAAVYFVFCLIQLFCLFTGGRIPMDITWSEYARQGFFQLLLVCVINLALVLTCLSLFRESRVLKGILAAISFMTYILIASSAYRMILYIHYYYLTFLRVFVLWALLVLAVLFAGIILSIFQKKFPLFHYTTAAVTCLYLVLAFAKPDYWIAKYDMSFVDAAVLSEDAPQEDKENGWRNGFTDFWYLADLSADALPLLADETYADFFLDQKRCQTEEMKQYYGRILSDSEMGVRDFNFSRWTARRSMKDAGIGF